MERYSSLTNKNDMASGSKHDEQNNTQSDGTQSGGGSLLLEE